MQAGESWSQLGKLAVYVVGADGSLAHACRGPLAERPTHWGRPWLRVICARAWRPSGGSPLAVSSQKPVIEQISTSPESLRRQEAPRAPAPSAPGGSGMWLLVAIVIGIAVGAAIGAGAGLYVFGWVG